MFVRGLCMGFAFVPMQAASLRNDRARRERAGLVDLLHAAPGRVSRWRWRCWPAILTAHIVARRRGSRWPTKCTGSLPVVRWARSASPCSLALGAGRTCAPVCPRPRGLRRRRWWPSAAACTPEVERSPPRPPRRPIAVGGVAEAGLPPGDLTGADALERGERPARVRRDPHVDHRRRTELDAAAVAVAVRVGDAAHECGRRRRW